MEINKEMIKEVMNHKSRSSDDFKKLPFYEEIMSKINEEYSNDEIEALEWILTELGRNVAYKIIPGRTLKEHKARVELTKDERKNNIKISIGEILYLLLEDGSHKTVSHRTLLGEGTTKSFYMKEIDTINEVFNEFDRLADKFDIINRAEALAEIERLTKYKR